MAEILLIFIYGLIFGSFFNVIIYRLPAGKSLLFPGSSCPACGNEIKWFDNIPLISWILLSGRCRYCHKKISIRYPSVELLTGIIFVLFFLKFGLVKIYFFYIIIISYLIILVFIDIDKRIVPDIIVILIFVTGMFFSVVNAGKVNIFQGFLGAVSGGFIMLALNYISNGKIGEGDIKLISALGICTGPTDVLNLIFLAFVIGALFSITLLLLKKTDFKTEIAFVPFIGMAFILNGLI